jgi:hypothetical protein
MFLSWEPCAQPCLTSGVSTFLEQFRPLFFAPANRGHDHDMTIAAAGENHRSPSSKTMHEEHTSSDAL